MSELWRSPYVVVKGLSKTEAIVEIVELGLSSYCVPYVILQPDNPYFCFFFFFAHRCILCKGGAENIDHMFRHCPEALRLWYNLLQVARLKLVLPFSCNSVFFRC